MEIFINKNDLKKKGEEILSYINTFSNDIHKLENVIDNINIAWQGADQLKYVNALKNNYINELSELANILKKYAEYLINVSQAYDLLDEIFSNKNIEIKV